MKLVFRHISASQIAELAASAEESVTLYAPGVNKQVALSLSEVVEQGVSVRFYMDISPDALRLGFFDREALRILLTAVTNYPKLQIYHASGLRQGVLVVDNRAWAFSVHSRLAEKVKSPCWDFPNGLKFVVDVDGEETLPLEVTPIGSGELENAIGGVPADELQDIDLLSVREEELDQKEAELEEREEELKQREEKLEEQLAHYEERCRLQKIDFKVQNYMIQNCSIHLKPELLIDIKNTGRIKMTYALYEKNEPLPDAEASYTFRFADGKVETGAITLDGLKEQIDAVREKYIHSLGPSYGNVILLDDKTAFEEALERLETMGEALHKSLQEVLRKKAVEVLKGLYQDLHQQGAIKDDDERMFLFEMRDELKRVSEKVFNLKCIRNYTIFQARDYESEAFQEAVCNLLEKRQSNGEKPIRVFSDDVKIAYLALEWVQAKE